MNMNLGVRDPQLVAKLRQAGLRPTRQRIALARLLFRNGDRHATAEMLHEEAVLAKIPVSLATIYNTLHQFTEAGLLREVSVNGARTFFDTNTSNHYHYLIEPEGLLEDIPGADVQVLGLPEPPDGTRISRIDVLVRLETVRR
jgi:Fur family iron response transcriptional regulator